MPIILIRALLIALLVPTVLTSSEDWALSHKKVIGIRSQRDVSANTTIDQIPMPGVELSSVLFQEQGYVNSTVTNVRNLLDVGIQSLVIDLYWNQKLGEFQLCPVPIPSNYTNFDITFNSTFNNQVIVCQPSFKLTDILKQVQLYVTDTETNLSANLLSLIFNLHSLNTEKFDYLNVNLNNLNLNNNSLSNILNSTLYSSIYTPKELINDRKSNITVLNRVPSTNGFPTLNNFLFKSVKRIIPAIWKNDLNSNLGNSTVSFISYNVSIDDMIIFTNLNSTFINLSNIPTISSDRQVKRIYNESWRFSYDTESYKFTNTSVHNSIINGFSPLITSKLSDLSNLNDLFNSSLWSWTSNEPRSENEASVGLIGIKKKQSAYRCGTITSDGWIVDNCYDSKKLICRNESDIFDWKLSKDSKTYFEADCSDYDGFKFDVPKSSLEQKSLINYLNSLHSPNLNYSYWIDMNCIAIQDCWVSGGPYATCPYQKVSSARNFVEMITPSCVFSFLIAVCIILTRFKRIPVTDNRKHWKKMMNNIKENDYEGVPS